MASVTEDSLHLAAQDIVAKFVDNDTPLNSGVKSKIDELGLNRDQAARLIERTNTEAFLKMFPGKTDFEVADPKVIFNEKDLEATTPEKTASYGPTITKKASAYANLINRDFDEIFDNKAEKVASFSNTDLARFTLLDRVSSRQQEELERVEKCAKDLRAEEAEASLWLTVKTAALNGRTLADMESELLLANPDKPELVCAVVDELEVKLAALMSPDPGITKRASVTGFNPNRIIVDSDITRAFDRLLEVM